MEKEEYIRFLQNFLNKDRVNKIVEEMSKEPTHCLRLNPLKKSSFLDVSSLKSHPYLNNAFYYKKDEYEAGKDPMHYAGAYYIQDASAMMVGYLLNVKKTDKVIDLCAAPGGKSTYIGPLLENGLLVSNDYSNSRCLDLIDNIERIGLTNTIILNDEVSNIAKELEGYFDKVVLDAPCSGEGMFRKNINVNEDWSIEKVNRLSTLQKTLILDAYKLLKKDGLLIYSTCTFNKLEDEDTVRYLLENTNATLVSLPYLDKCDRGIDMQEAIRIFPDKFDGEGHFICLIKCNDDNECKSFKFKQSNISPVNYKIYKEFENKTFNYQLDKTRLFEYNDVIYYLPVDCPDFKNLHIMRQGVMLGSIEKNIFKPSHNLASSFNDLFKNALSLRKESKEMSQYLHGDSFKVDMGDGYAQVLCEDVPLGLCKVTNQTLKNLYPKKLRKVGL